MEWNIAGHEWAVKMLQQHIARSEVRHAYLFTGPLGIGRMTLALRFAQSLNCTQPPSPGAYCGRCRICSQTERLQLTDLSLVEKHPNKKDILVDQVRELQHVLSLTPYEAQYRIAILRNFEDANPNAQNALLKTLEEAPPKVILLLTASSVENLLPTIVSRCETLRLRPMPVEVLAGFLEKTQNLSRDEARKIAHLTNGRFGYAMNILSDPAVYQKHNGWIEDLHSLLPASKRVRFSYAEKQFKKRDREVVRGALSAWLSFWRDILLVVSGASVPLINLEWEENIRNIARMYTLGECRYRVAALEQGIVQLDTTNINAQLLVEVLLLD
jgi:DNA polymerase-3 subunit delta'